MHRGPSYNRSADRANLLVALLAGTGTGTTLAGLAATAVASGNTLTTGTWGCGSPGSQTVTANADTYVYQALPDTNYGTASVIGVSVLTSNVRRTLVQFALPVIPNGCQVTSAMLRLYTTSLTAGRTYQTYRVGGAWAETTVTWNNQPATSGTPSTATTASGWVSWTVTAQVQSMYTGGNNGFLVKDSVENVATGYPNQYSSRSGANPPQLVITLG